MPTPTIINAIAPIRIADIGGWTDTWFARRGAVCSIAVYPYAEVQVLVSERRPDQDEQITVYAENFDLRFAMSSRQTDHGGRSEARYGGQAPGQTTPAASAAAPALLAGRVVESTRSAAPGEASGGFAKLPLIEAAIQRMAIPERHAIEVRVHSEVPPGASTGTSAAVSVAIIGALDQLTPGRLTPYEIARLAHAIETEDLGLQSGVQDQLASAFGGINLIDIPAFPHANVAPVGIGNALWWDLEQRLALIYVGKPHQSSAVHQEVIRDLGAQAQDDPRLERLRVLARDAKNAIFAGDWRAYGAVMDANTAVQRGLHSSLVSPDFERVIAIARRHGALGCKVNGAGGDGGSVTVLGDGQMQRKRAMLADMTAAGFTCVPIYLARQGLRVWTTG